MSGKKALVFAITFGVLWLSVWSFGFYTVGHSRGYREGMCFDKTGEIMRAYCRAYGL